MKEENKNRLSNLLFNIKDKEEKAKIESEQRVNVQEKFLSDFETLCKDKIEPIMTDIGLLLKNNDHDVYIEYAEEGTNERHGKIQPYIMMNILRSLKDFHLFEPKKYPHIQFVGDKSSQEVFIYESTISPSKGGQAGAKRTRYKIEILTDEIIEKEIVESVENILKDRY